MPKAKVISHFVKDLIDDRSSHQKCSVTKGVLRKFTQFTGKHLGQSLFFNKVAGLNFCEFCEKFLRTPFLQNISDCFCIEIWQITCCLKDLRTLLKPLQFVYYSNRTPYLELHSPTKSVLPDVPHKYKKGTLFYKYFLNFLMFLFRLHISKLNSIIKPQRREYFIQSVQLT